MNKIWFFVLSVLFLAGCSSFQKASKISAVNQVFEVRLDTSEIFDMSRNRKIPLALYSPITAKKHLNQKVVIYSHGYGANQGGDYLKYSYLTETLASKGYFVVSIQHELPADSLMPTVGIPRVTRKSNWERGTENIKFVLKTLKETRPDLDYKHLALIGHSNGGDMSALFAEKYPDQVDRVITLDNRRMALPRTKHPRIFSLRSSDLPADEGVLPSEAEQKKYGMMIFKLKNTRHAEMDNDATETQQKEINEYIVSFLED